jgi:hypothetical protein
VVAIDPVSGRIGIGNGFGNTTSVDVSFHHGFPADLGGGPYERGRWLVRQELAALHLVVKADGGPGVTHTTVADALADWATPSIGGRANAIVTILDSRAYDLPPTVRLPAGGRLVLEAANGQRPLLRGDETAEQAFEVQTDGDSAGESGQRPELTLSGVLLEGFVRVTGDLGRVRLLHSTLVPGRRYDVNGATAGGASLSVTGNVGARRINAELRVELAFSVTGPLEIPAHADRVVLVDSILDGLGGVALIGPRLVVERSTVLGGVQVRALEASNVIFTDLVEVERSQGCVRFTYVPRGSRTPARYHCQPDLAADTAVQEVLAVNPTLGPGAQEALRERARARLRPVFVATRFGEPAYAQLDLLGPPELATGAEDGAEMGAYCHIKQAQRESNLRIRLAEYLPLGLDAAIVYAT